MANLSDRTNWREEALTEQLAEFLPMISEVGGSSQTGAMYDAWEVDSALGYEEKMRSKRLNKRLNQPSAAPRSGTKMYDAERVAADLPQHEPPLNAGRSDADRRKAMQDSEDVLSHLEFQKKYGEPDSLISGVSEPEKVPGSNAFMDWLKKDSTQVGVQGLLGSLGAVFGGMAGIPAGGGDMSSMERAAVRAAAAPGEARARMRERKFIEYIDNELATETSRERRELLQAARANPKQAAQYLAMEGPESKQRRLEQIAKLEHEYRMEELELRNEGALRAAGAKGRDITPGRQDLIYSANAWFRNLTADVRESARKGDFISLLFDPSAIKFVPYLYSPKGGMLWTGPESINMDLSGDYTYNGETVSKYDMFMEMVESKWDQLNPDHRRFYDLVSMKHRAAEDDPELSDAGRGVAGSLGLESE